MNNMNRTGKSLFAQTLLAVSLMLAMAFTLSCSSDDGDEPQGGTSSSGLEGDSSSSSSEPEVSSSSDSDIVQIGEQVWMKKNLNIEPTGTNVATNSWCYGDDDDNCDKYGRLYDWATAMALDAKCNTTLSTSDPDCAINTPHQGICPDGFHIPSNDDWDELFKYIDEQEGDEGSGTPYTSETAGKYLKAASGWNSNGNGTDKYGFSALPGGARGSDGNFNSVGDNGYWWSASEYGISNAYSRYMSYHSEYAKFDRTNKTRGYSVRCVKDN